jgi:hypothetical protein
LAMDYSVPKTGPQGDNHAQKRIGTEYDRPFAPVNSTGEELSVG